MLSEILNSPVAIFITIIVSIHLSVLVFMARQKAKREIAHVKHLQTELKDSEKQIQQLFDTMSDNRRVLTESLRELASIEDELNTPSSKKDMASDDNT